MTFHKVCKRVQFSSGRCLGISIPKLINNSSSLNKGYHDRDSVWISDLNQHRRLRFYSSVFSLVLVSIEKIYQTRETVFHHISKHLEVRQKYSAARFYFLLFSVQTLKGKKPGRCLIQITYNYNNILRKKPKETLNMDEYQQ